MNDSDLRKNIKETEIEISAIKDDPDYLYCVCLRRGGKIYSVSNFTTQENAEDFVEFVKTSGTGRLGWKMRNE